MLPHAARIVADRLATALMPLVHLIANAAEAGGISGLPRGAAHTLFSRLSQLVIRLIRIENFGVRASVAPAPRAAALPPLAAPPHRSPAVALPRRPGWLLAALPDAASVLAELRALLADPAIAPLLDAVPALGRALRSLRRALGAPLSSPPDTPPRPAHPPPITDPPPRDGGHPPVPRANGFPTATRHHTQLVTIP